MTINAVFGIAEPLQSKITDLSLELKRKYDSKWWVDNERYLIHLPLYLFECPEKNRPKVIEKAEKFAQKLKKTKVKSKGLFYSERGLIMIEFSLPEGLYQYHKKALQTFNPLRKGIIREIYTEKEYWKRLSDLDKELVRKYGNKWVLDNYKPHITIANISSKENPKILDKIIERYDTKIRGSCILDKFQIHEPKSKPVDKTELLFSRTI